MIKVIWVQPDGSEKEAMVEEGINLMDAALEHDIDGVIGECGGSMACATCHVEVDPGCGIPAGEPQPMENEMLDVVEYGRTATSRLSCQLIASPELDGIRLKIPG